MRSFKSKSYKLRIAEIEGESGMGAIRLRFADGTTRGIQVARDFHLTLFQHVCTKTRAYPPQPPEGIAVPQPPPEPQTPSDELIQLLCGAESIETESIDDPTFLKTIHQMCQTIRERRKEKQSADSN